MTCILYNNKNKFKNFGGFTVNWMHPALGKFQRPTVVAQLKIGDTDFDPDVSSQVEEQSFVSSAASGWLEKLEAFTERLQEIPDSSKDVKAYEAAKENNDKLILAYASKQLEKNGMKADAVSQLTAAAKAVAGTSEPGAKIISLKKILNVGKWKGFMEAVSIKTQQKRNLDQQVPDIGMDINDFAEIQANLAKVSQARSGWGRYTASKKYIENTTPAAKLKNQQEFEAWVDKNANEGVKILALTFADIPPTYAAKELGDFAANPTDPKTKQGMEGALRKLQKEAVSEWKKSKPSFKLADWLGKL